MGFPYRCMKCRGRNNLKRKLKDYVRTPKCKHCGHKAFYVDKERWYRKDYCRCEGYHHTHRKGSTFCIHNANYEFNVRTLRYGEDVADVAFDVAVICTGDCPF